MLRQQARDVDAAEEVELRRLEGHPGGMPIAVQWLCSLLLVWWRMASTRPSACAWRCRRGRWLVCAY